MTCRLGRPCSPTAKHPTERVGGSRSTRPVVELGAVDRRHPLLAGPHENVGLRREPLVEAIERALLNVNDAGTVLQIVGERPGTAVGTEDAIEPLARTCFGIRGVGVALRGSAEREV